MKNKLLLIAVFQLSIICCFCQNAGIGNTTPNASAQLDVSSTTKGVLIPRMTTAERTAIAAPATGILVFDNTRNSFWFYNGRQWMELTTGSESSNWSVLGNNIYNSNLDNVGIGASTPFENLTVDSNIVTSGGIGIETATPDLATYKLNVNGSIHNTGNIYTDSSAGIGTITPNYKLQANGSSVAIYNSGDSKFWVMHYNNCTNSFQITEGGTPGITILNGGNTGFSSTSSGRYTFVSQINLRCT